MRPSSRLDAVLGEVLVDGLARAGPVAVVVDDQHAAGLEARVQVLELVLRRLVPVGVEAQQRDAARGSARGSSPRPCP